MKKFSKLVVATALLLAGTGIATAQKAPAKLGGHPNLNGIWQTLPGTNWNVEPHDMAEAPAASQQIGAWGAIPAGVGVVEGGTIPYKPEALKQRDENRKTSPAKDPEAACYLPGIPRATYMDHPFQIIQGEKGDILLAYGYASANRVVLMRAVEVPPIDTWMGTSYGSWEGDTLKVVTLAQNGMSWLDRAGNFVAGTATVTERFKLRDADHIQYDVTIEDPETFTKPWKMSMPIYRDITPNAQLLEFKCVPAAEKLLYGDLLADKDKYPKK